MAKGHFRPIEMEEVHQLNRSPGPKRSVIHSTRLVVKLDVDGEYFHLFYDIAQ